MAELNETRKIQKKISESTVKEVIEKCAKNFGKVTAVNNEKIKLKKIQDMFSIKISSIIEIGAEEGFTIVTIRGSLSATFIGILWCLMAVVLFLGCQASDKPYLSAIPIIAPIMLAYAERRKSEKKFAQISNSVFEMLS